MSTPQKHAKAAPAPTPPFTLVRAVRTASRRRRAERTRRGRVAAEEEKKLKSPESDNDHVHELPRKRLENCELMQMKS